MTDPKVSIIIPIYKTEKYLRDCLLSVQRQTMPDFEALLVNDCTPDNAMEIAREFAQSDSRFRILEHHANKGLGAARNTGIAAATGKYLNFLDSDDRMAIDTLELLLNQAEQRQADMVIGNMAWINIHQLSRVNYIDQRIRSWSIAFEMNLRKLAEKACLVGSVCNRLIRTELVHENNIKFPEGVYYEDIPFSMAVWFHSVSIFAIDRFIYFRRFREDPDNLSITQVKHKRAFTDRDLIAEKVFVFASNQNTDSCYAARLGIITLTNLLATTKDMLSSVEDEIKNCIAYHWFPVHALKIDRMINQLIRIVNHRERQIDRATHSS